MNVEPLLDILSAQAIQGMVPWTTLRHELGFDLAVALMDAVPNTPHGVPLDIVIAFVRKAYE